VDLVEKLRVLFLVRLGDLFKPRLEILLSENRGEALISFPIANFFKP
jgi:hypothetical protein